MTSPNKEIEKLMVDIKSNDWMVRESAVNRLGEINAYISIAPLIQALADRDTDISEKASFFLKSITSQDFGRDSTKWHDWWERNKTSLEHQESSKKPTLAKIEIKAKWMAKRAWTGKIPEWTILLSQDEIEFSCTPKYHFAIPKEKADSIKFSIGIFSAYNVIVNHNSEKLKLLVPDEDMPTLLAWVKLKGFNFSEEEIKKVQEFEKNMFNVKKNMRNIGGATVLIGLIHFAHPEFFAQWWGIILIIAGILYIFFPRRKMFIVDGVVITSAGVLNVAFSLSKGGSGWTLLGILQLVWGINEIRKFKKYSSME